MKKMKNSVNIEGYLYEHKLEERTSGENSKNPGTKFIRGTVSVATDEELLNIITVSYVYATDNMASAPVHETFINLSNIINGTLLCSTKVGKERASKVRLSTSIGVNDFISNRTGTDEMVSAKRNEGGFLRVVNSLNEDENKRNTFDCDMVITEVTHLDEDTERKYDARTNVTGYIFNFRNEILPVTFSANNPGAMRYFEGLNVSEDNPFFTRVRGNEISTTVMREQSVACAFGDPQVTEVTSNRKEYNITWAQPDEYVWNDETTCTKEEFNAALEARNIHLADVKTRNDAYQSSRNNAFATSAPAPTPAPTPARAKPVDFDF